MEHLLYLVHRIPFPPNKGDKIRSFHILKYLAEHYRVHVGAFVDDPEDERFDAEVSALCQSVFLPRIHPTRRKLAALAALPTGRALSESYYRDARMQRWVDRTMATHRIDKVLTFSSTMCQFVAHRRFDGVTKIADFVDMDSKKWTQYAEAKPFPMSQLYALEGRRLLAAERRFARRFDRTVFVTEAEADLFGDACPDLRERVGVIGNGVDTERFDPALEFESPYGGTGPAVVFVGAMDYWANVDAVVWFAHQVWPELKRRVPSVRLYIVGMKPTEQVVALGRVDDITVTGAVPDVRPYVAHAHAVIAPLKIARGVQNKVLEALSMARPIVASTEALSGIDLPETLAREMRVDEPVAAATRLASLCSAGHTDRPDYRRFIEARYSWEARLAGLAAILDGPRHAGTGSVTADRIGREARAGGRA